MVYLRKVVKGCVANIATKLQTMEPCCSINDRIGIRMIFDTKEKGLIALKKVTGGEPTGSYILSGRKPGPHKIECIGVRFVP
ncbi:hypothetical protein QYE76_056047 [Lolium multiflorum]|uniref:Uncharacterized protein n=1 Tax=Lolium multiflorum TaxID=4521 RepID=A0AAD8T0W2_LOLMU|nr:hypothetical protein QYE76_056047 [Lolium multiflorum]